MIAKILYRDNTKAVLEYITKKDNAEILGYQNMYSKAKTNQLFFENTLNFLNNRSDKNNKVVHISLNLSLNDTITNNEFFDLTNDFMSNFGYGNQPYVVVKHNDTDHNHVHILTSRVRENSTLITDKFDYNRAKAISRELEIKYNLDKVTSEKSINKLEVFRNDNIIETIKTDQGARNYIREVINLLRQKNKFKSLNELKSELKKYDIKAVISESKNGILFGLETNNNFKTPVIPGSKIHVNLSLPKLEKEFDKNKNNKSLKSIKQRIIKQFDTLLDLYESINIEDYSKLNLIHNNTIIELIKNKKNVNQGYKIYDKSKYIFKASELGKKYTLNSLENRVGKEVKTSINFNSKSFDNLVYSIINEAFKRRYFKYIKKESLYSEIINTTNLKDLIGDINNNEKFKTVRSFMSNKDRQQFDKKLKFIFLNEREKLLNRVEKSEHSQLKDKHQLLNAISDHIQFDSDLTQYHLIQSLGLKKSGSVISFINSDKYEEKTKQNFEKIPDNLNKFYSPGLADQNYRMLEYLFLNKEKNTKLINDSSFFLPMIYPELYNRIERTDKLKYEKLVLTKFFEKVHRSQIQYEKNQYNFIQNLNHKGIFLSKERDKIFAKSIFTDNETKTLLSHNHYEYLNSTNQLDFLLYKQQDILSKFDSYPKEEKFNYLWLSNLIDKKIYDKAAFMIVYKKMDPIIPNHIYQDHLKNGLQDQIMTYRNRKLTQEKINARNQILYSLKSLLNSNKNTSNEAYNGFKDELTDYSKYRNLEL
ncbi:Relaxase/Mobilisation nuclease domain-containing protein [Tenacibaculum sp. MAR_2009_124]|uniref:relaxase/mobilization nuclease domain-containing protein n=1 Tax=Tenacibaculum sp. MAR_2009_124 TaxID=1250059 RepID=UPI00089ABA90|nr:relaxase/mobilization nuclease domain-containing protein [Tenacibaculum sp. MAR_2009_124]SEC65234.1 Relaxase/Mobilisation nuclease domain-containing protein [Tenacibaculum sp. MAR_2009_124]